MEGLFVDGIDRHLRRRGEAEVNRTSSFVRF